MIVAYSSNDEVLVCEKKDEKYLLQEWFAKGTGRNRIDYDRTETNKVRKVIEVKASCSVSLS